MFLRRTLVLLLIHAQILIASSALSDVLDTTEDSREEESAPRNYEALQVLAYSTANKIKDVVMSNFTAPAIVMGTATLFAVYLGKKCLGKRCEISSEDSASDENRGSKRGRKNDDSSSSGFFSGGLSDHFLVRDTSSLDHALRKWVDSSLVLDEAQESEETQLAYVPSPLLFLRLILEPAREAQTLDMEQFYSEIEDYVSHLDRDEALNLIEVTLNYFARLYHAKAITTEEKEKRVAALLGSLFHAVQKRHKIHPLESKDKRLKDVFTFVSKAEPKSPVPFWKLLPCLQQRAPIDPPQTFSLRIRQRSNAQCLALWKSKVSPDGSERKVSSDKKKAIEERYKAIMAHTGSFTPNQSPVNVPLGAPILAANMQTDDLDLFHYLLEQGALGLDHDQIQFINIFIVANENVVDLYSVFMGLTLTQMHTLIRVLDSDALCRVWEALKFAFAEISESNYLWGLARIEAALQALNAKQVLASMPCYFFGLILGHKPLLTGRALAPNALHTLVLTVTDIQFTQSLNPLWSLAETRKYLSELNIAVARILKSLDSTDPNFEKKIKLLLQCPLALFEKDIDIQMGYLLQNGLISKDAIEAAYARKHWNSAGHK